MLNFRHIVAHAYLLAAFTLAASLTVPPHAVGQEPSSLASIRKLYVPPFGNEKQDDVQRQSLLERLKKSGKYSIVDTAKDADAILKGDGQIWVKGYFTINSRAVAANRQPVYAGYLSVELTSRTGQPLWSSLVTPSKFAWGNISDDLADKLADEMLRARKDTANALTPPRSAQTLAPAELNGAGATFPAPLYRLWFQSFEREHPEIRLSYAAVGSEAGVTQLAAKSLDFAASEVSPQEIHATASRDIQLQPFATVLGAVVPIYHLDGLTRDLNFTAEILADIYLGKINRWNDAEIRSANKGANLPDTPIVVIHRSDGSGTTHTWSDFLSKTDPEWKNKVGIGTQLTWPVGQGVEGSEGISTAVEKTPNAIGYVEFVYAIQHQLGFGAVRNSSGQFVRASLNSLAEAAKTIAGGAITSAYPSITNPPQKGAYPIASFTWLLIPEQIADPAKKKALTELIRWELTSGQKESSALGYAPLPPEVAAQQLVVLHSFE